MNDLVDHSLHDRLDSYHIEQRERIPDDPDPGNYVVIDVMHFSATVVELFANGAEYIHVTEERGNEFAFKEDNPNAKIGGGSTEDYEPTEGYDFFNSPSYVQSVDVSGHPVSMTSTNGGAALVDLRESDDVDVYVGSTTNAAALADHLQDENGPTYLVSAGSSGGVATEDHIGAALIGRYLEGVPVPEMEIDLLCELLEVAKGPNYVDSHERRRRDVLGYTTAINSRSVVPKLDGEKLYDVSQEASTERSVTATV